MKVMVIVKASPSSEAGEMPSQQLFAEMGKYNEELVKAGIMQTGAGLHPSSKAVRVRFSGKNRVVTDGPFAETRELIAGFWIWKVSSMAEAIEWVKRCPNPMNEESDIDIRPIFEAEDFGEAFTPELRQQEASIRAQALGLAAPRFENGREMVIAGLNEHYTHETRVNIPKQWERFVPHLGKIAGQVGGSSYGVVWRTTPDFSFEYLCGVEVQSTDKLPSGFTHVKLTTQRYAVFEHREHISTIGKTIDAIWTKWVPDCGLKIAQTPCFERYTEQFNPRTGMGGTEIWVPIAE